MKKSIQPALCFLYLILSNIAFTHNGPYAGVQSGGKNPINALLNGIGGGPSDNKAEFFVGYMFNKSTTFIPSVGIEIGALSISPDSYNSNSIYGAIKAQYNIIDGESGNLNTYVKAGPLKTKYEVLQNKNVTSTYHINNYFYQIGLGVELFTPTESCEWFKGVGLDFSWLQIPGKDVDNFHISKESSVNFGVSFLFNI